MKNTQQILLCFIFCVSMFQGEMTAQGWQKLLGNPNTDETGHQIIPMEDGGYLICGSDELEGIIALRTDQEGELLWRKSYGFDENGEGLDMIQTMDSNYVITGFYEVDNLDRAVLLKIDAMGDSLWTRVFTEPSSVRGTAVEEASNGDIFMTGWKGASPFGHYLEADVLLARTDADGNLIYYKNFGDPNEPEQIYDCLLMDDEDFLLWGSSGSPKHTFLAKVDPQGDTVWTKHFLMGDPGLSVFGENMLRGPNGNLFCIYKNPVSPEKIGWLEMNPSGNVIDTLNIIHPMILDPRAVILNTDSTGFIFAGEAAFGSLEVGFILEMDLAGNISWEHIFGLEIESENWFEGGTTTSDGGYAFVGRFGLNGVKDIFLTKTDSLGQTYVNTIRGNIFYDSLATCLLDSLEPPLAGWVVIATGDNHTFYDVTDEFGNYEIVLDTGNYVVSLPIPNAYWLACYNDSMVYLGSFYDTLTIDFPVQAQYDCPILNVDVSTTLLRRCYDSRYYVSYCNEGTVLAEDAYVEIYFDEYLTVDSSSLPWTAQNGQTYTFDLGDIDVGDCGGFIVYVTVDCDSTFLGQTHCVSAHIYPDSICLPPNTSWDGSTVVVDGNCTGDSLLFRIRNVGDNDMLIPKTFIVIEDQVLHLNGNFQLPAGDSLKVDLEATGATYRLEAEQADFHPTNSMPSVTIEGCTNGQPISLGFVNWYSEDDADPFVSRDCRQNVGSYDPNDKKGFPQGIGMEHIIFEDTELEYFIRFQNTGTDTAFLVVIRDTLSEFLDLTTIRPGASSHPYTWDLQSNGALKFVFDNIMLPDSNINEPASHGFVKFKIAQQPSNLPGTIIHNQAAIYFDFNAPVITNRTDHKIDDRPLVMDSINIYYCDTTFYTHDTIFTNFSEQLSFDMVTTNFITVAEPQALSIDTILMIGQPYQGIIYENDTSWVEQYTSIAGCDSVITINLQIMPNGTAQLNHLASQINLFPNPSAGQVQVTLDLEKKTNLEIEVVNQLGFVLQNIHPKNYPTGKHTIPISLVDLPAGIYWIHFKTPDGRVTGKLVKGRQ